MKSDIEKMIKTEQEIPIWWVMENTVTIKGKARCIICYESKKGIVNMKNEKEIKEHFMNHIDILFSELL